MLNGDITFKRANHHLNERDRDWYSQTWKKWMRDMLRCMWCVGFAVTSWKPVERYGHTPVVVCIEGKTDVRYYRDELGDPHYRVFRLGDVNDPMGHEIKNVVVYSLTPPSPDGSIVSKMRLLAKDFAIEQALFQQMLQANKARSNPPVYTEEMKEKSSSSHLTSAYALATDSSADRGYPSRSQLIPMSSSPYDTDNFMALVNGTDRKTLVDAVYAARRPRNRDMHEIELGDGRHLVTNHLAESPAEVLEFRRLREQRVLATLGISPNLVNSEQLTVGNGSNILYLFMNMIGSWKSNLLDWARDLYRRMNSEMHLKAYLESVKDTPLWNWKPEDIDKNVEVKIELPGVPREEVLTQLYEQGLLKAEALKEYYTSRWGIDKGHWRDIDPMEEQMKREDMESKAKVLTKQKTGTAAKGTKRKAAGAGQQNPEVKRHAGPRK